jgi:hypothetical protein
VDEESPQELVGGDGHDLVLAAVSVVLPAEGDSSLAEGYESVVGDRDAVGVASQIVKYMLGSPEGWLGIDDPVLGVELSEELAETLPIRQLQQ